jgi:hypothetical protein
MAFTPSFFLGRYNEREAYPDIRSQRPSKGRHSVIFRSLAEGRDIADYDGRQS